MDVCFMTRKIIHSRVNEQLEPEIFYLNLNFGTSSTNQTFMTWGFNMLKFFGGVLISTYDKFAAVTQYESGGFQGPL